MADTSTSAFDTPYQLDSARVAEFEEQGLVKLSGVLGAELIESYEPMITAKVIELNTMHLPLKDRSTYDKAFLQVINLWRHSDAIRRLVFSTRLARIAAELLGVDGVRLLHDQALHKEPGGGITPWHADQYYWPMSTDRCCTIWLPLQDTPLAMGPLEFAAGSHRFEYGRDLPISDESEAALQQALAARDFPVVRQPFAIGEASYHLGWTFHRASPNTTDTPRGVMTVIYMDADMPVGRQLTATQQDTLEGWLPGARPGEVPNTPLNPLIYRRTA